MRARLLAALLAAALPALAEDPPAAADAAPPDGEEERFVLLLPEVVQVEELSGEAEGKAFALLGRVVLDVEGLFRLRAQRIVVWLDPETDETVLRLVRELREEGAGVPLWTVRAIYAEGGRVPAVFQRAGQIFRCSSLYYDFTTMRGVFVDADLRLQRGGAETPDLVLRAKRFLALEPGRWEGLGVTVFSSDYVEHDVAVEVERVRLDDPAAAEAMGKLLRIRARDYREGKGPTQQEVDEVLAELEASAGRLETKRVGLYGIEGRVWDRTVFRWKETEADGENLIPLRVEIDVGDKGGLDNGGRIAVGLKTKPLAWLVGFGYFSGRGPVVDVELDLDAADGRATGATRASYIHDHGSDRGIVPPTRDRYFVQNRYRFGLTEFWRLDAEVTDISDAQWLRTWDEREFKEGKEQETLVHLRGRGETGYVTATGKLRTIGFQDTLEEAPRVAGVLPVWTLARLGEDGRGEPVTLQLAATVEAANLRHRAGDGSLLSDFRTTRLDLDPTLFVSFGAGPFRVVPFAAVRGTAWEETLDGSSAGRFAGLAGLRVDTQVSRWFGGVRHVVNVSFVYEDLYAVTEPAANLVPLDATDLVTPYEMFGARWRNRLQRLTPEGLVTFVDLEFFAAWFPDGQQPFGRRGDALLETDLEWRVRKGFHVAARTELDTEGRGLETAALEGWLQARHDLRLGAGVRHLAGDSDVFTATVELDVDTRWRLTAFSQTELRDGDSLDQVLLVQRLGKTAVFGFRIGFDPGDSDFSFGFKVDLLERFRAKERRRAADDPSAAVGSR